MESCGKGLCSSPRLCAVRCGEAGPRNAAGRRGPKRDPKRDPKQCPNGQAARGMVAHAKHARFGLAEPP